MQGNATATALLTKGLLPTSDNDIVPYSVNRQQYLLIKRLYLIEGQSPKEISAATGLTREYIGQLASRRGWAAIRRAAFKQLEEASTPQAIEEALQGDLDDFSRSVSTQSEELAEKAFGMGRAAKTPFDLNQAAGAAAKLVGLHRLVHGLDRKDAEGAAGRPTINFFVVSPVDPAGAAIDVSPPREEEITIEETEEISVEFG